MKTPSQKMAFHEINWWKAHHRKEWKKVSDEMVALYVLQFGFSPITAKKCVAYRLKAGKEHDLAEKFEDAGDVKQSIIHWKKAEALLVKHFASFNK